MTNISETALKTVIFHPDAKQTSWGRALSGAKTPTKRVDSETVTIQTPGGSEHIKFAPSTSITPLVDKSTVIGSNSNSSGEDYDMSTILFTSLPVSDAPLDINLENFDPKKVDESAIIKLIDTEIKKLQSNILDTTIGRRSQGKIKLLNTLKENIRPCLLNMFKRIAALEKVLESFALSSKAIEDNNPVQIYQYNQAIKNTIASILKFFDDENERIEIKQLREAYKIACKDLNIAQNDLLDTKAAKALLESFANGGLDPISNEDAAPSSSSTGLNLKKNTLSRKQSVRFLKRFLTVGKNSKALTPLKTSSSQDSVAMNIGAKLLEAKIALQKELKNIQADMKALNLKNAAEIKALGETHSKLTITWNLERVKLNNAIKTLENTVKNFKTKAEKKIAKLNKAQLAQIKNIQESLTNDLNRVNNNFTTAQKSLKQVSIERDQLRLQSKTLKKRAVTAEASLEAALKQVAFYKTPALIPGMEAKHNSNSIQLDSFNGLETEHVWSTANSSIRFRLAEGALQNIITIDSDHMVYAGKSFTISLNSTALTGFEFGKGISIPENLLKRDALNIITIAVPDAVSPAANGGPDTRILGVSLKSITVK